MNIVYSVGIFQSNIEFCLNSGDMMASEGSPINFNLKNLSAYSGKRSERWSDQMDERSDPRKFWGEKDEKDFPVGSSIQSENRSVTPCSKYTTI